MDISRHRGHPNRQLGGIGTKVLLICGLVAIGFLVYGWFATRPRGSESDQVVAALNASIEASKKGESGGVLDKLSEAFTVNRQAVTMREVANVIDKYRPAISVEQPKPVITGDTATIISSVTANLSFGGNSQSFTIKNVVINFRRESAHTWLIYPVSVWRVTDIRLPDDVASQLASLSL